MALCSLSTISDDTYRRYGRVFDCSEGSTPSHAGIFVIIEGNVLTGGANAVLSKLVRNQPENFIMMAIQEELLSIAKNKFVRF